MAKVMLDKDTNCYSSSPTRNHIMPMTVSEFTRLLLLLKTHDESRKTFLNTSGDFLPQESWTSVIAPAFNSVNLSSTQRITTQLSELVVLPTPLCPESPSAIKRDGLTLRRTLRTFRDAFTAALLMCDRSSLAVDDLQTYFFLVGFDLSNSLTACFLIAAYMIGLENEDETKTDFPLLRKLCSSDPDHSSDQCRVVHSALFIVHDVELSQYPQKIAQEQEYCMSTEHLGEGISSSFSTFLDDNSNSLKKDFSLIGEPPRTECNSFSTTLGTDPTACSINGKGYKASIKDWSIVTRKSSFTESDVLFFENRERLIRAFARASRERSISTDPAVQKAWDEQYQSLSQILFASSQCHSSCFLSQD